MNKLLFVGGTEKKMRKKVVFFCTGNRDICVMTCWCCKLHPYLPKITPGTWMGVTETSALRIQEAKTAIAVQLEDREGVARTAVLPTKTVNCRALNLQSTAKYWTCPSPWQDAEASCRWEVDPRTATCLAVTFGMSSYQYSWGPVPRWPT